jgi:K+-transporting ATPase ATPase A chain
MIIDLIIASIALAVIFLLSIPTGKYIANVYIGEKTFLTRLFRPIETWIYRCCGIDETEEMNWKTYAIAVVLFNTVGIIVLYALQLIQGYLPFNPQKLAGVRWDTAFNAAISFVTNTNWQSYSGEATMSYLTQMLGLTVQNFISPAVGMAVMVAMIRSFIRKDTNKIGNYWVDLIRSIIYILIPICIIFSLVLVSQGVIQTFHGYATVQTLEGGQQTIALGPTASQIAIKQIGTNGGGFFNVNSSHPFENSTGFTNLLETLALIFFASALVFTFGYMIRDPRQARAIFFAKLILVLIGLIIVLYTELQGNPIIHNLHITGGNMEGKEVRVGVVNSVIWGHLTTVTANGSVNSMHDSQLPLTAMVYMFNMGIGEVLFGGLGVGLIGILFFIFATMYICGLMIGRTPEYLGKKLGPYEMIWTVIALLSPPFLVLIFSSIAIMLPTGLASLNNPSSHGLSEILYAYLSGAGNNGSAFAGLNANTNWYNVSLGLVMLISRFTTLIPALAIAGSLAKKKIVPSTSATFPTTGVLFVLMVVFTIIIMGALTYFPAFTLGPILEQLFLQKGLTF